MKEDLPSLFWSSSELGSGLEALARKSELRPSSVQVPNPPSSVASLDNTAASRDALSQWIESAASWLGLEAEPSAVPYEGLEQVIENAGLAVLQVPGDGSAKFLFLFPRPVPRKISARRRGHISVLAPDLRTVSLRLDAVRTLLCSALEETVAPEVDRLLDDAGIPESRRGDARAALLLERLRGKDVGGCWLLRQSPGAPFLEPGKSSPLAETFGHATGGPCSRIFSVGCFLVAYRACCAFRTSGPWLVAGMGADSANPGSFSTYSSTWLQGVLAINGGILFKQRLLFGALRLRPEEIRHKGVGQFLGEVMESEAVESLALSVGFQGLTGAIELIAAEFVLSRGVGRGLELILLPAWFALTLLLGVRYFRQRQRWTESRLSMTNDLTERMVGHRTRLAQEARQNWHDGEDEELERYLEMSRKMDGAAALLMALAPRGWLLLGMLGLTGAFAASQGLNIRLAISLGGILLAYRALKRLSLGLIALADAIISWQQVAPLFQAAGRTQLQGSPAVALTPAAGEDDVPKRCRQKC